MSPDKTKYLFDTFPNLYKPENRTESLMRFGFPGDGWFEIIKKLSEDITAISSNVEVVQVKEKFGSLRYYFEIADSIVGDERKVLWKKISNLVSEAEAKCDITCEECGSPGHLREDLRWVLTLCDECYNKIPAERKRSYVQPTDQSI